MERVDVEDEQRQSHDGSRLQGVSLRAIILGFFLLLINSYWVTLIEVRWYTLDGTSLPLFITPVFLLFVVTAGNAVVGRLAPARRLNQVEMITIYVMVVTSCVLAGHDMLQNLFGAIAHAQQRVMANPLNGWKERFFADIPHWLFIWDPDTITEYYNGGSFYSVRNLRIWGPPLLAWSGFVSALLLVFACVNVLIRKHWMESERLVFPLVQLPLAMTEPSGAFWRSRPMWAGFSLAFLITAINGLHDLYPSIPALARFIKQYPIGDYFTSPPLNAIRDLRVSAYPFAIGIGYFMPLDLSFSIWFFYVARRLFQIVGAMAGWNEGNADFPYLNQQASGAWLTLAIALIWSMRRHIGSAWKAAFGRLDKNEDRRLFRFAFIGLAVGATIVFAYFWRMGLSWIWAAAFFGIYFLLSLAITRIRAEVGAPHEIYFVNPQRILYDVFGSQGLLSAKDLTVMQSLYWFNRGYRCHPMPNQLEAMKMAQQSGMKMSKMLVLALIVGIIAIPIVYWANLHITYAYGAQAKSVGFKWWVGEESFGRLNEWLTATQQQNPARWYYMSAGSLIILFLRSMSQAFSWWPFRPAGYALAISFAAEYFWFPFFLSWLFKFLLTRYGGMRAHRWGAPFALGLVLGDYVMGSVWAIVGPALNMQTYRIFI